MTRKYRNKPYYEDSERLPVSEELEKVPDPVYGKITKTSALIMREGPSQISDKVCILEKNDRFQILDGKILGFGINGESCYFEKIKFKGKVGYIMSTFCEKDGESYGN